MKFSFKIQQYQTDAVNAVVDVFKGQVRPAQDTSYFFDPGRLVPVKQKKQRIPMVITCFSKSWTNRKPSRI